MPESNVRAFAMSQQQTRTWALGAHHPALRAQVVFDVGDVSEDQLKAAVASVIASTEILRTTFRRPTGMRVPVQAVLEHADPEWRTLDAAAVATGWDSMLAGMRLDDFDFGSTPPIHFGYLASDDGGRLVVSASTLVADEASLLLLAQAVASHLQGPPSPPEEEPLEYAGFAGWQSEVLEDEDARLGRTFWAAQDLSSGATVEHPLAADASGDSFRVAAVRSVLSASAWDAVRAAAEEVGQSPELVCQAVWQGLLARLTGADRVPVATRTSGRLDEELEETQGPFAAWVPVCADVSAGDSTRTIATALTEVLRGLREWEPYFDWELLSTQLGSEIPAALPFGFAYRKAGPSAPWPVLASYECGERVTLQLDCDESASGLELELLFDQSRFSEEMARGVLDQLLVAMQTLASDLERSVDDVVLVERAPVAAFDTDFDGLDSLHGWVAGHAETAPDRVAVVDDQKSLTYRGLWHRAAALASELQTRGVRHGDRIALCLARTTDAIVAQVAVSAAGAAYVPLDGTQPSARLDRVAGLAGVRAVVIDADTSWAPSVAEVLNVEDSTGVADRFAAVVRPVHRADAAYVLYTSGTTGEPKGVVVEHGQVAGYTAGVVERLGFPAGAHVAHVSTLAADLGNTSIFGALRAGATLHVVSEALRRSASGMADYLRKRGVEYLKIVPSHLDAVLAGDDEPLPLRGVVLGGEATSWSLLERLRARLPHGEVVNHYGPTETTVGAIAGVAAEDSHPLARTLPLGLPLAGYHAAVETLRSREQPVGVEGELVIGGVGVTRGYLNDASGTADRFRPDPMHEGGSRRYHSGDLARVLPGGTIEFRGRIDDQVKIRGYRVEVAEVEAVLGEFDGVREVVAAVRVDDGAGPRLIAYGVFEDSVDSTALSDFAATQLPEYMVPSAVVPLDSIPLTANGKVDRAALPDPASALAVEYVEPRSDAERSLAAIWTELLGVDRVGVHDDFFDLGGHSLSAMQMVSRIRQAFDVELPLLAIFEQPTIEGLARAVGEAPGAAGDSSPAIDRVSRDAPIPASFAQEGLWLFDRLNPGSNAYNIPAGLQADGPFDPLSFTGALEAVVDRHEVLRTSYGEVDGRVVQVISPDRTTVVDNVDLGGLDEATRTRVLEGLLSEHATRPFDLESGPVWRAAIVRLGPKKHALLWNQHHIASDAWSAGIFLRELAHFFSRRSSGQPDALAPLPIQYADFASWQRGWLEGEGQEADASFWKSELAGVPPRTNLPFDRPAPASPSRLGRSEVRTLSAEGREALAAVCRDQNVTPFVALLTAFYVVLHLHSGQDDLVIGTPVAGRSRGETEGLLGFFLNTLALRSRVDGASTYRELVQGVRRTVLEAFGHQDLPFDRVRQVLELEGGNRASLYNVMFNLQVVGEEGFRLGDLGLSFLGGSETASKFDLTLYATETPEQTVLRLVYDTDVFADSTGRALAERLARFVEAAALDPDRPVAELGLVSEVEQRARNAPVPVIAEHAADGLESGSSIIEVFDACVARSPQAIAVRTPSRTWSYERLQAESYEVARRVAERTDRGGRVGLLYESDAPLIASMLGVLRSGRAYVPLDPANPTGRLEAMANDSGTSLVLCDAAHEDLGTAVMGGAEAVRVAEDVAGGRHDGEPSGVLTAAGADMAYILYTSGSTGRPKGVVQSHENVLHHIRAYQRTLGISADDTLSFVSSYGFDGAVMDIFGALLTGATLVPLQLAARGLDGALEALSQHAVTVYHSTPTVFRQLFADADVSLPEVRAVVLGGEEATRSDFELFKSSFEGDVRLVNGLGPSESTLTVQQVLDHDTDIERDSLPIGRPVQDTEVVLLDAEGRETPYFGEIAIRSSHVALGYWDDAARTREAFSDLGGGTRQYRTGDMARWLPDGSLQFAGRGDDQIKIRGFRIELGEIEAVLSEHESVAQCAVLARSGPHGQTLVAYVQPSGVDASLQEVRGFLEGRLPSYMIPSEFAVQEALPTTPNGKLDRARLAHVEVTSVADVEFVPPEGEVEERTSALWTELLGDRPFSRHDDFFRVGGQSLLAMQLVSRIRKAFEIELPLRLLFESPTLSGMSAHIAEALGVGGETGSGGIVSVDRDGPLPLSFGQQRMWILDQIEPGTSTYNVPTALDLEGPLSVEALEHAIGEMHRRHEVLRTTYGKTSVGDPTQRIAAPASWSLPIVEVPAEASGDVPVLLDVLAREEARRPFDLEKGPLLRVLLLRVAPEHHFALLTMHHIISDAWSTSIMVRELSTLYGAFSSGTTSGLDALDIQYADFASWQRTRLDDEALAGQVDYWRRALEGAPELTALPLDRPRGAEATFTGAKVSFSIPEEVIRPLLALANDEGVTPFVALLAAFKAVLRSWTGSNDLVVGTPVAGRNSADVEPLIGFFINTLVLRTRLDPSASFRSLVGEVRETLISASSNQDVPFERIVDELQPARGVGHTPLFQVAFVLQNAPQESLELSDLSLSTRLVDSGTAKFDWSLSLIEHGDGVVGSFEYNTDLFDRGTIERVLGSYEHAIGELTAAPDRPLSEVSLLGSDERRAVAGMTAGSEATGPIDGVVERVERVAAATPDSIALEDSNGTVTYGAFNRRANAIAAALRSRGVTLESRVAVLVDRSTEMVATLLGVMKCGAAYVPLDPTYPEARLRYMLEDSGAELLVTRGGTIGDLDPELGQLSLREVEPGADAPNLPTPPLDAAAYVIYTSGSTGRPKGVVVPHRGLANLVDWHCGAMEVGADDRSTMVASLSFDAAVWELWPYLATGSVVQIASEQTRASVPELIDWVRRGRSTIVFAPTPLTEAALAFDRFDGLAVRRWLTGGDRLRQAHRAGLSFDLVNNYGPTENSVVATSGIVAAGSDGLPSIGRAIDGVGLHVVGSSGELVPIGAMGELWLSGVQLSRGYHGQPGATAERFVPNSFTTAEGARAYRTGDLVRWRSDGELDFSGREDGQVKVRGYRIEVGEVESVLAGHPSVAECAVRARPGPGGDDRLIGWLVPSETHTIVVEEVRAHAARLLPGYMVPAVFAVMEALPQTPGGKLDQDALPDPEARRSSQELSMPESPTQRAIADIWSEVLSLEDIALEDRFFDLGGHSLTAVQVLTRLQEELGATLEFNDLVFMTLGQIAAAIDDR